MVGAALVVLRRHLTSSNLGHWNNCNRRDAGAGSSSPGPLALNVWAAYGVVAGVQQAAKLVGAIGGMLRAERLSLERRGVAMRSSYWRASVLCHSHVDRIAEGPRHQSGRFFVQRGLRRLDDLCAPVGRARGDDLGLVAEVDVVDGHL